MNLDFFTTSADQEPGAGAKSSGSLRLRLHNTDF
jgi:hypothetical protein